MRYAAAIAALAIGAALVAVRLPTTHHARGTSPPPGFAGTGRVVAQDPTGNLVLTQVNGTGVVALPRVGAAGGEVVVAALDRRFLATVRGAVAAVNGAGLGQAQIPVLTKAAVLGGPDTFADGDRALIVAATGNSELDSGAVSAITLTDHQSVDLGIADEAAGDPQAVGAFVSVPAQPTQSPPPGGYLGVPDSRVERRDAGRPAAVLATAAQLNADLGQKPAQPVHLSVFPNPSGDAVAVLVNPPTAGGSNVGMVILDRSGRPMGVVRTGVGPVEYDRPAWSPDGRSLVYATLGSSGTAVAIWSEGHVLLVRTAPDNGADFGYCLWSPDASAILCPTFASARVDWDMGLARGGPLFSVPAPGTPIIWLPTETGS